MIINTGRELRAQRMARNVELRRFAKMLKLNMEALRSIEREEMPGHPDVFARACAALEQIDAACKKPQAAA